MPRIGRDSRRRPKHCAKDLRLGTWNVLSLNRAGALDACIRQLDRYKMDITAVQEVRWPGSGVLKRKEASFFYSGHPKNKERGVGFIVNPKLRSQVIGFSPIDDRICCIRVRGKFRNLSLISVYAPTEDHEDSDKEEFYEALTRTYDSLPAYDMKIILGDFNAKVGREEPFQHAVGRHSLHEECNDNGLRLVSLAMDRGLTVSSTTFPRKDIYKATWMSNDHVTRNQIDHVLVANRHRSSILDVKSRRGADCDSDHCLVVAVVRERISLAREKRSQTAVKWNTECLKDAAYG